ncbi:MAG: nicotinate-nucleotide adenylyltransferase [Candidatus Eisenbacteria bacterium]|nr:nicotinate-nucleotide adenylyltransferase [Candidatus Eisenbacteria bacterium]
MRRVGLFGGTFDPPHAGHLAIAEWAREQLGLDRVVFMPAGTPPHKRRRDLSSAATRLAMTRLALRGRPGFCAWTLETRRRGPSFTVDTLRHLRRRFRDARLYLILGADSLDDLRNWQEPGEIVKLATLAVAPRPGISLSRASRGATFSLRRRGVVRLEGPALAVSSSAIRARVRAGRPLGDRVPEAVARYIRRHRLYRNGA